MGFKSGRPVSTSLMAVINGRPNDDITRKRNLWESKPPQTQLINEKRRIIQITACMPGTRRESALFGRSLTAQQGGPSCDPDTVRGGVSRGNVVFMKCAYMSKPVNEKQNKTGIVKVVMHFGRRQATTTTTEIENISLFYSYTKVSWLPK